MEESQSTLEEQQRTQVDLAIFSNSVDLIVVITIAVIVGIIVGWCARRPKKRVSHYI